MSGTDGTKAGDAVDAKEQQEIGKENESKNIRLFMHVSKQIWYFLIANRFDVFFADHLSNSVKCIDTMNAAAKEEEDHSPSPSSKESSLLSPDDQTEALRLLYSRLGASIFDENDEYRNVPRASAMQSTPSDNEKLRNVARNLDF